MLRTINSIVTGQRYSTHRSVTQGGLENPCKLLLVASKRKSTNSSIFLKLCLLLNKVCFSSRHLVKRN